MFPIPLILMLNVPGFWKNIASSEIQFLLQNSAFQPSFSYSFSFYYTFMKYL